MTGIEPLHLELVERALNRLVQEFVWRVDHGEADSLHELFTDEASVTGAGLDLRGRRAIAEWGAQRAAMPRTSRHICLPTRVTGVAADHARGVTTVLVFRHDGDLPAPAIPFGVGDYLDEFTLVDGVWLFAERVIDMPFVSV